MQISKRILTTVITVLSASQASAFYVSNIPTDLFARIEGWVVVYDVNWDTGAMTSSAGDASGAGSGGGSATSAETQKLADAVAAMTGGAVRVSIDPTLDTRGSLKMDYDNYTALIRISPDVPEAERFGVALHEISHWDVISSDGPLNFNLSGANSLSLYQNAFAASEVIAFATSQAGAGALILDAAVTHPADVRGMINNYYDRDLTSWIGTYNTTTSTLNSLQAVVSNASLMSALINSPETSMTLQDGSRLVLSSGDFGVALSLFDSSGARTSMDIDGDFATPRQGLDAIASKIVAAQAQLAIVGPNSPQSIAMRNQNDAAISLAIQIVDSHLGVPVSSILTPAANGVSNLGVGCVGGCAVGAGVVSALVNSPIYNSPKTVGDNSAAVVANARTAVAVATTPAVASCSFAGSTMQVGSSVVAYTQPRVYRSCGETCAMYRVTQRCTGAGLSVPAASRTCQEITNQMCP